ncbi:dixin-like [Garra rufa]|uniref:dixin-like n=1 Tax=Garra rufa TaxID=137080 RepID=UPI003CCE8D5A
MIASLSKGNLLDVLQEGPNEQQLAAYVSWVNAQLRKKPGLKPVSDLRQDLRDGVVLAHLIEIVAGELLDGIHYVPRDDQERKQNVEKVLQFVSSKRIRMPQTSARDIVEGNLKSAMRLILALAAHFKPSASASHRAGAGVGRSSTGSSANHRPHSTMAMAQNAAAALAAARQDASRPGRSVFHLRQEWSRGCSGEEDSENPCLSVRALVQQYEGQKGTFEEETGARSTGSASCASGSQQICAHLQARQSRTSSPSDKIPILTDGERGRTEREDEIEGGLEGEGKQRKAGLSLTSRHRKRGASKGGNARTRRGHADLSDGELYEVKESSVNRLN